MGAFLLFLTALCLGLLLGPEEGFGAEAAAPGKTVVAEVNGKVITVKELEEPLAAQIDEMERELFALKKKKLDELIGQQLLKEAAAAKGLTVDELLAKEVYSKVPELTDEQVEKFYQENKHRMVQRPEAELKQKSREILKKLRLANQREKYIESLQTKAKVSIYLTAPKPRQE